MLLRTQNNLFRGISLLCSALLVPGDVPLLMAQQPASPPAAAEASAPIPADQLDSLVAPIALYPDPLLAQVLAASTYPLELVQLQQWLTRHKNLKEKELAEAVKKENWDPSIQGLAALPDVVKQLADNIKWTSELGNAFLAQQSDVMDAVQRMRAKAKDGGKLKSTDQMKVETKVVESKTVVVIEQANPQVVYVPSYDPVVVWGAPPVYAYPPVAYPVGYYAAGMALSFGVGVAMGAMWGGGWGYNAGWGGNNTININNNNNFVNNSNRNSNRVNGGNRVGNGNGNWQHNPQHRGGAPYGDRSTANKFGGTARGDSAGNRQASARQNAGQGGGGRGAGGASNFAAERGGGGGGSAGANRGGGGADRVGNRQASGGAGSGGSSAFGGGSRSSGASARSSSSRGSSSFGGGGSRGGGGGGGRGGGRRR
jgi:hypothetical protein